MAVVTRFFSTAGAGAADGTTWADRAALFSAGNWSAVITGFAFNGTDSMKALIGPGTYTCSQSLATGLFANPPTAVNPLIMHGCDSSGVALTPPDADWTSNQAAFSDATLPEIATASNITMVNLATAYARLVKFTASARSGVMLTLAGLDWCVGTNTQANTSAGVCSSVTHISNSVFSCTGTSYSAIVGCSNGGAMENTLVIGNAGSSGNRDGITCSSTTQPFVFNRVTVRANGGRGIAYVGTSVGVTLRITNSAIVNNTGDQILFPNTASQTAWSFIDHCIITGGAAFGINPGGANTNLIVTNCRLRDNTSGNFGTFGNWPSDFDNYTTDSDDTTEYVDSASGDFRIKTTAATWGKGYGPLDQLPSGGSSAYAFC